MLRIKYPSSQLASKATGGKRLPDDKVVFPRLSVDEEEENHIFWTRSTPPLSEFSVKIYTRNASHEKIPNKSVSWILLHVVDGYVQNLNGLLQDRESYRERLTLKCDDRRTRATCPGSEYLDDKDRSRDLRLVIGGVVTQIWGSPGPRSTVGEFGHLVIYEVVSCSGAKCACVCRAYGCELSALVPRNHSDR